MGVFAMEKGVQVGLEDCRNIRLVRITITVIVDGQFDQLLEIFRLINGYPLLLIQAL